MTFYLSFKIELLASSFHAATVSKQRRGKKTRSRSPSLCIQFQKYWYQCFLIRFRVLSSREMNLGRYFGPQFAVVVLFSIYHWLGTSRATNRLLINTYCRCRRPHWQMGYFLETLLREGWSEFVTSVIWWLATVGCSTSSPLSIDTWHCYRLWFGIFDQSVRFFSESTLFSATFQLCRKGHLFHPTPMTQFFVISFISRNRTVGVIISRYTKYLKVEKSNRTNIAAAGAGWTTASVYFFLSFSIWIYSVAFFWAI